MKTKDYQFHHWSLAKGYIPKGCTYDKEYVGRFGEGFTRHLSYCECPVSRRYHVVEYWIKKK